MQLSPRQYQADPTGAAYVQDTRPLMAAMGAQAATQIEGNRMMTETMQKGMQGIENFAARRQLAATRAQLGALKLEDPDYGQKLAGLVLDNPLAFTNAKTAPLAEMAFKQASNTYLAKEKNKADALARYQDYRYGIDAINAKMQGQSSLMDKEYSRMAADTFRAESSAAVAEIKRIDQAILENKDPRALPFLQSEKARAASAFTGVKKKYEDTVNRTRQSNVPSYAGPMEYAPLPGDAGVPVDGAIVSPNLSDQQNLDASLIPNAIEGPNTPPFLPDYENRPPLMSAVSPETARPVVAPISPSDIQYGEPMPSVEAPAIPAAPVTSAGAVAPSAAQTSEVYTPEQIAESRRAYEASLREPSSTSRSAGKMTQSQIDNLAVTHPDVRKARLERDVLRKDYASAENELRKAEKSEDETLITAANTALKEVSSKLTTAENNFLDTEAAVKIRASLAENPFDFLSSEEAIFEVEKRKAAQAAAESQKVKLTDVTSPEEINAFLAATRVTPAAPPPDPTIGMSALQKEVYNIEAKRQEAPLRRAAEKEARRVESNAQWNKAKEEVYDIIGGAQGLAELLNGPQGLASFLGVQQDQPLMEGIEYNANIPENKPKLANELAQKIREKIAIKTNNKKLEGFEQKLERLGPQKVSQEEIIAAVVEEIIRAKESTAGKVSTMPRAMAFPAGTPVSQPVREALGNTNVNLK